DGGAGIANYAAEIRGILSALSEQNDAVSSALHQHLSAALDVLEAATQGLIDDSATGVEKALAGATPYLKLFGITAGGAILARGALAAQQALTGANADTGFLNAKRQTAQFYAENILSQAKSLLPSILHGHRAILEFSEDQF
ncbi:MAG: acyl-CoA dehydrogenase, partial [Alphaproteobacteria bacterium]